MNKNIILLGTASGVGKSTLACAFCRYFKKEGYKTAPFKALNISLNSYVTEEGLEMGRAQVVQAEACGIKPSAFMNPILLKPSGNGKTQVIVNGKVYCNIDSYKYREMTEELRGKAKDGYNILAENNDVIVLEGSGSCAEINLKDSDIANTHMAKSVDAPIILVSDIDRGGVFASVVGTLMLLSEEERERVKGVIINKFRGNADYFKPAMKQLEDIIKVPVLGVMPYFKLDIEDEDGVTDKLNKIKKENSLDVAVIKIPHMSNFTDFNSLNMLKGVSVRYVSEVSELGEPNLILIPGTKNTIQSLKFLKESGLFEEIKKQKENGTLIFGICGGYQMLGKKIKDPLRIEGENEEEDGFGFLDMETIFNKDKTTKHSEGTIILNNDILKNSLGNKVVGYEIHNGVSNIFENNRVFIEGNDGEKLGICDKTQRVYGTYLHGVFDSSEFLNSFFKRLKEIFNIKELDSEEIVDYETYKNSQYEKLEEILRENIDMQKVQKIIGLNNKNSEE